MSEYWKSTPKYWCKHCKTFVKDTKLEKQNHEGTPKHQGNLKRFLRDLHRGNERDEREKQCAKDEVARLNATNAGPNSGLPERRFSNVPAPTSNLQATPAERKQQMTRLAEMGVAIPEEFRREMAMVGDWQTMSQRVINEETLEVKNEEQGEDTKLHGLNVGVRKRKHEEEEEDTDANLVRRGWGNTTRMYPAFGGANDDDLDALLSSTATTRAKQPAVKIEANEEKADLKTSEIPRGIGNSSCDPADDPQVKVEETSNNLDNAPSLIQSPRLSELEVKEDVDVVFKKRKPKAARQK